MKIVYEDEKDKPKTNRYGIKYDDLVAGKVVLFKELPLQGNGRLNSLTQWDRNHHFLIIDDYEDEVQVIASTSNGNSKLTIIPIDNHKIKDFEIRGGKETSYFTPYSMGFAKKDNVKKILGTLSDEDLKRVMDFLAKGVPVEQADFLEQIFEKYNFND